MGALARRIMAMEACTIAELRIMARVTKSECRHFWGHSDPDDADWDHRMMRAAVDGVLRLPIA